MGIGAYDNGTVDAEETPRDVSHHEHTAGTASTLTTVINIVCNIIGGGILVLPTAMKDASLFPGLVLLLVVQFLSLFSMYLLVKASARSGGLNYTELMRASFGPRAAKAFNFVLFLYPYAVLIAYARIIADLIPPVVGDLFHVTNDVVKSDAFCLGMAAILFWFLSSAKTLTELKFTSFLGIATIMYTIVIVVVRFFDGVDDEAGRTSMVRPDVDYFKFSSTFPDAFAILAVAFSCHYNVPSFYQEMADRTPRKFVRAAVAASSLVSVSYIIIAVLGYLQFGNSGLELGKGNVLRCFDRRDVAVNVGRFLMFFHFACVYPIICLAARRAGNIIVFGTQFRPRLVYVGQAFVLVATSCTAAYFIPGVGIVISFVGSFFGISIVVVLPALFYLRLYRADAPPRSIAGVYVSSGDGALVGVRGGAGESTSLVEDDAAEGPTWVRYMCYFAVVFGVVGSLLSIALTIRDTYRTYH